MGWAGPPPHWLASEPPLTHTDIRPPHFFALSPFPFPHHHHHHLLLRFLRHTRTHTRMHMPRNGCASKRDSLLFFLATDQRPNFANPPPTSSVPFPIVFTTPCTRRTTLQIQWYRSIPMSHPPLVTHPRQPPSIPMQTTQPYQHPRLPAIDRACTWLWCELAGKRFCPRSFMHAGWDACCAAVVPSRQSVFFSLFCHRRWLPPVGLVPAWIHSVVMSEGGCGPVLRGRRCSYIPVFF